MISATALRVCPPERREGSAIESIDCNLLSSPEFNEIFAQYRDEAREQAISIAIRLLAMAKPDEIVHIPPVLKQFDLGDASIEADVIIGFFERAQQIRFDQSLSAAKQIATLAFERLKDLMFHGTHIRHLASIREKGLSVTLGGKNPEVDRIQKFAIQVMDMQPGELGLFGWRYNNCRVERGGEPINRIALWPDPEGTLFWAKASPEWFYCFTSRGHGEDLYQMRDKGKARQYLEERIALWKSGRQEKELQKKGLRNLTEAEAEELRQFFEKTWEYYKELRPTIIKVIHPLTTETSEELLDLMFHIAESVESDPFKKIRFAIKSFLIFRKGAGEVMVETDIPPEKLTPFILP